MTGQRFGVTILAPTRARVQTPQINCARYTGFCGTFTPRPWYGPPQRQVQSGLSRANRQAQVHVSALTSADDLGYSKSGLTGHGTATENILG